MTKKQKQIADLVLVVHELYRANAAGSSSKVFRIHRRLRALQRCRRR